MFGHDVWLGALPSLARALGARLGTQATVEAGWPSLARPPLEPRGAGLWLELGVHRTSFYAALWLETALAVALVDHALDGTLAFGASQRALSLSEAEEGVLAYVVARLCAESGDRIWLRGVHRSPPALPEEIVTLSLALSLGERTSAALLYLDPTLAGALETDIELSVPVSDDSTSVGELNTNLALGDLLLADELLLSGSATGLLGCARASAEGLAVDLAVALNGATLHAQRAASSPQERLPEGATRFVLHEQRHSLRDLAILAAGHPLPLAARGHAELRAGKQLIARGPLVRARGKVGVLVESTY